MIKKWSEFNESTRYYISWRNYITRDQFLQQCRTSSNIDLTDIFEKIEDFLSDFDIDEYDIDYNFVSYDPMYFGVLIKSTSEISGNILDRDRLSELFPKSTLTIYDYNKIGFEFRVKPMLEFNENRVYGSKIQAKIDLLKDLSLDLTDMGLKVDIWNGSWKDDDGGLGGNKSLMGMRQHIKYSNHPASKSIIMMIQDYDSVLDEDGYYENELVDKKEITDLENSLISYGMNPIRKFGIQDKVYFMFNKQGKTPSF